jgi:octaprenyl-diphosphate synthase
MAKGKKRSVPGIDLVKKDIIAVEKLLKEAVRSDVALVVDVSHHILGSGGKRFRPLLTLLAGQLVSMKRKNELFCYAAGIEYAHTSTLLHDDVIDEADIRRGEKSANREFGNAPSIIVGDYLLFSSFGLMLRGKNLRVVNQLTDIAIDMAEGEAYQLTQKTKVDLSEEQYERIIRSKTALLIKAACQIPAIAAGVSKKEENALGRFGYNLGLAFQIVDDVLDYSATDSKWGKEVGKDFFEGKTTIPLIIAYHDSSKKDQKIIRSLYDKNKRTKKDLKEIMTILNESNALDKSLARARARVRKGQKALSVFPDNPAHRALCDLADYVVDRTI